MNHPTQIKFFRSFAAEIQPVQPCQEISQAETESLNTYYEARYDDEGRVREFIKHLRERNPDNHLSWLTMFTEKYEYWPSGRLQTRLLVAADGSKQTWNFPDTIWSKFKDWFGKPPKPLPEPLPEQPRRYA